MRLQITNTVKHLLIINFVVFIGALSIGQNGDFFRNLFAMHFLGNDLFKPWQVITHMFMHATYVETPQGISIYWYHILFNMFGLWMFGTPVEQRLGSKRFLFLYISAGLGAVLLQSGVNYFELTSALNDIVGLGFSKSELINTMNSGVDLRNTTLIDKVPVNTINSLQNNFLGTMVGASGCLFGILVAFAVLNPNAELMLIFFPIPIKAKYFISLYVAYDIISGFMGSASILGVNIAHWAHVGGAIIGFIITWYWKKNSFNKHRWD